MVLKKPNPDTKVFVVGIVVLAEMLSYIFSALPNDVRTYYMGLAYSAKYYQGSEFAGVLHNWELKGFLSRYILWFPHKFAMLFFDYQSQGYYRMYSLYYVSVFILALIVVCLFYHKKQKNIDRTLLLFFVGASLVLATSSSFHMQAEMSVVIILMIATVIYYSATRTSHILMAGILAGSIIFIKTSMAFMLLAVFGMALYLSQDFRQTLHKVWPAIVSAVISIVIVIILLKIFYPQEIQDAMDVPELYRTTLAGNSFPIKDFVSRFLLDACYGAPFILSGICLSVYEMVYYIKKANWKDMVGLFILWFSPFLAIYLSGRTNVYYYNLFLYSTFVVLMKYINHYAESKCVNRNTKKKLFGTVIICVVICCLMNSDFVYQCVADYPSVPKMVSVACVLMALLLSIRFFEKPKKSFLLQLICVTMIIYTSVISCFSVSYHKLFQYEQENVNSARRFLNSLPEDRNDNDRVLYLDDGLGLALLGNESYSRYFFPIPVQRCDLENNPDSIYAEEYEKILHYDGQYILINENWFYSYYENIAIREKISQEYEAVASYTKIGTLHTVFCGKNDNNLLAVQYKLLKRKNKEML